jgi:hypothetical protein
MMQLGEEGLMLRRMCLVGLVAFLTVPAVTGTSLAAPITPTLILGGPTDQILPDANASFIGWTHNTKAHPRHYNAYVQPLSGGVPTGGSVKLNTGTGFGWFGGIRPDANEAAFQQTNARQTQSDIRIVDLDVLPLAPTSPPGLNTSAWEFRPSISADWILFGRNLGRRSRIYLYDRTLQTSIALASARNRRNGNPRILPDDVTQAYATWTKCGAVCNVYYYNLSTKATTVVPNPSSMHQYNSSVSDATGDMYFVTSGSGCGVGVEILRWHIGDPLPYTVVATLPSGYDVILRTTTFNDGTNDNIFFDRVRCAGKFYSDIYQVPATNTA